VIKIPNSRIPTVFPIRVGPYVVLKLITVGSDGGAVILPVAEDMITIVG
jgi:hypothetical protein